MPFPNVNYDQWGGITVPDNQVTPPPVVATNAMSAVGDPCLSVILDFLKAFVVNDSNATRTWAQVFQAKPPINQTFPHDPSQVVFQTTFLPALFMWRDSAKHEWIAEDWLRETTQVKGLWVFPLAQQENERIRAPYINQLIKSITVGIERGRTPAWVQSGDTDPNAATLGSLFYTYADFEAFSLDHWRHTKLVVPVAGGKDMPYPAIEMTFTLAENLVYGMSRFAALNASTGGNLTLQNDSGTTQVAGPI